MSTSSYKAMFVSEIARKLKVSEPRVEELIQSLGIQSCGKLRGITPIYLEAEVQRLAAAILKGGVDGSDGVEV